MRAVRRSVPDRIQLAVRLALLRDVPKDRGGDEAEKVEFTLRMLCDVRDENGGWNVSI